MAFAFEAEEAACADAPAEGHGGGGDDGVQLEAGTEAVAREEGHAEAAGSAWDLAEVASWEPSKIAVADEHVSQVSRFFFGQ